MPPTKRMEDESTSMVIRTDLYWPTLEGPLAQEFSRALRGNPGRLIGPLGRGDGHERASRSRCPRPESEWAVDASMLSM